MKQLFNRENLKFGWWFVFNLLVTLFVVSLLGVRGADGQNGTDGSDGLNGQDGTYIRNILAETFLEKPTGSARLTYANRLINEEGYLPIDELADFETYFYEDFEELRYEVQGRALELRKFVLTADLDFTAATERQRIPHFFAIGDSDYEFYFRGIFDGAGFIVSNFSNHETQNIQHDGFFPRVEDAVIRNVTFIDAQVINFDYGSGGNYGTVVGISQDELDLINVTVAESLVASSGETGGLVGRVEGSTRLINTNVLNSDIASTESAGGFIGRTDYDNLLIANSASIDNTINGYDLTQWIEHGDIYVETGGFVGEIDNLGWLYVYRSYNTSRVSSQNNQAGGFFGHADNVNRIFIAQSYNSGWIDSLDDVSGGFIGELDLDFSLIIQDSFNLGTVYGQDDAGGFIGNFQRDNRHPNGLITNSYNAGTILNGGDGSYGGFIGDVDNSFLLTVHDSFNVGEFSRSLVTGQNFENSVFSTYDGAIIGDTEEVLFNRVYFYVDLTRSDYYLKNASDLFFDFGTEAIYAHSAFTSEDFILEDSWDFTNIWEFNEGYDYPTLKALAFFEVDSPSTNYRPSIWGYAEFVNVEGDNGSSAFDFYFYYVYMSDAEDLTSELTFELYMTLEIYDNQNQLSALLDTGEQLISQTGYPTFGEIYQYTPEALATHYLYAVVTDTDGNTSFSWVGEFNPIFNDLLAPKTTDPNITASFVGGNITSLSLSFKTATDNITEAANLTYYLFISNTTEAYADVETAWFFYVEAVYVYYGQIIDDLSPFGYVTLNLVGVSNLQYNTEYYLNLLVVDELNNKMLYDYATIQLVD